MFYRTPRYESSWLLDHAHLLFTGTGKQKKKQLNGASNLHMAASEADGEQINLE